jgi:hypothetical protein
MSKFTKYCKRCDDYINSIDWLFTKSKKWVCNICLTIDYDNIKIELCKNSEHNDSNIKLCNNIEHIMDYKKKNIDTKYCEGCNKYINVDNFNVINGRVTNLDKWLCYNCFDQKKTLGKYCSAGCGNSHDINDCFDFFNCEYKKCDNIMCIECDYNDGFCNDCIDYGYNYISEEDDKNEEDEDTYV